jgi:hypothetical protein
MFGRLPTPIELHIRTEALGSLPSTLVQEATRLNRCRNGRLNVIA